jgi:1-acyl-sn-glycerol-3-phosphate acyltransferase
MKFLQLVAPAVPVAVAWLAGATHVMSLTLALLSAAYAFTLADGSEARPGARFSSAWHGRFSSFARTLLTRLGLGPDVIFDEALSPAAQRIFAIHPHGVMSFCHVITWCAPAFLAVCPPERRRALGASSIFMLPIIRDIVLASGGVLASRPVAHKSLQAGYSLTVVPGGEREQIKTRRGEHSLFLQKRKGFCRLALAHGVPLIPCYCFGETDTYHCSSFAFGLRLWLATATTIAVPLASGPSWLNPLRPHPVRLTLCVGAPIEVEHVAEPTSAQVDAVHAKYVAALREMFDRRKAELGYAEATLTVG